MLAKFRLENWAFILGLRIGLAGLRAQLAMRRINRRRALFKVRQFGPRKSSPRVPYGRVGALPSQSLAKRRRLMRHVSGSGALWVLGMRSRGGRRRSNVAFAPAMDARRKNRGEKRRVVVVVFLIGQKERRIIIRRRRNCCAQSVAAGNLARKSAATARAQTVRGATRRRNKMNG